VWCAIENDSGTAKARSTATNIAPAENMSAARKLDRRDRTVSRIGPQSPAG